MPGPVAPNQGIHTSFMFLTVVYPLVKVITPSYRDIQTSTAARYTLTSEQYLKL